MGDGIDDARATALIGEKEALYREFFGAEFREVARLSRSSRRRRCAAA